MSAQMYELPRRRRGTPVMFGVTVVLFAVAGYGAVEGHTQFALLALALAVGTAVLTIATSWTAPSRIELGVAGVTLWSAAGWATTIPWSDLASVTLAQGRYPRLRWARVDGVTEDLVGAVPDVFGLLTDVRRWAPHARVTS